MELRAELLKSIWYAFTALDAEKSGKVSKSQLKVLSHNLYTVLCIPHDPVALEEHFKDDDDGPVSSQGYMPYLNKYILDKVEEGTFVKERFDELCWTLSAKKNYKPDRNGNSVVSYDDAFRLWCLFNFLSEDKYPLVMVPDEVEYLLKKICTAMSIELNNGELDDYFSQETQQQSGLTVWQFLDLVNSGRFLRGIERDAISMAIEEIYQEIIGDVLKQQGYLWKKGHLRRNWSERWFTLKPSELSYYVSEERKEKKGSISLDRNSCVEILPDKDGKRCMFCVKTASRTYEMSASDTKQRQEWTLAIQMAIRLNAEGKKSLHKDLKQKRREQREQRERKKAAKEEEMQRLKQLQEEKERKLQELELLKEAQRQAEFLLQEEEQRRQQQHEEMQRTLEIQLREAEQARASMQAEMVLKEAEAERQRKRITELENMQQRLQDALQQEIKARQDEEAVRYAQARLLAEEEEKLKQLMKLKEEQEEYIIKAQHEKLALKQEMENKSKFLEEAQQQLEVVRFNRERMDQDVMLAQRKLEQASTNVKHWNVQMNRLMHPIAPGEKRTMTSGGFTGFSPALLSRRDSSLKLKQNLEKKKSDAVKNESKENINGETETQMQMPDNKPSSEAL
ncbi:differentially expressed in FDCP 6 homolog isoform X1 [Varanus komodoensis]|uniref:differentially expressed in FDCP 6 homolog isoform X1 n=1 Tax=Varanus komodoensis TaxID=61221 RepID=UPI001CF7D6A8|nr:differentially expressed in FDCP 6 homolog isoform X1 [Varanus komodoensis]